jgi:Nuclease A inhibitor-like protein
VLPPDIFGVHAMNKAEVDNMKAASEGLLYPSETDFPLEFFSWDKQLQELTEDGVRKLTGHAPGVPVEEVGLAEFFEPVIAEQDWHGEREKESTERFRSLVDVLQRTLDDLRVYRVGETEVDAYIVGRTKDGEWAGLKTKLVET